MARIGVNEQDIFEACRKIEARGDKVTALKIREELGDTGSMTTITAGLRAWKEQANTPQEPIKPLPEGLLTVGNQAVQMIWDTARAETETEIKLIRETYEQSLKEKEDELKDILALTEKQDTKIETLKATTAELNSELTKTKTENIRQVEKIDNLQIEIGKHQSDFANLKKEFAETSIEKAKLEQKNLNFEDKLKDLLAQLDRTLTENKILTNKLEKVNNESANVKAENARQAEELKSSLIEGKALKTKLEKINHDLTKRQTENIRHTEQVKNFKEENNKYQSELANLKKEYDKAIIANAKLEQKSNDLSERLKDTQKPSAKTKK